jgi:hypothetical protein
LRITFNETDMKTREFIKAGMVNNGTKVMVNKGAEYECGRQSDHRIVGYVQEPFEATCVSTPKIFIHSDGIQEFEYAHLTCVDINGLEYCIDISHCKYSNVDSQKDVTILI